MPGDHAPVRVAVVGNVDSGKSTLIGVLSNGELDDGRGSSRRRVALHGHEVESGRTSAITTELLGFGAEGEACFPRKDHKLKRVKWKEVMTKSERQVMVSTLFAVPPRASCCLSRTHSSRLSHLGSTSHRLLSLTHAFLTTLASCS